MNGDKTFSEKLTIGLFVEGQYLHVACLSQQKNRIKLVDAQIIKLSKTLENVKVQEEVLTEVLNEESDQQEPLELSEEIPDAQGMNTDSSAQIHDNAEVLRQLLRKYSNRKNKLALTLSEPQIYYSYYASDWGLDGKKLHQKILEELFRERQNGEDINTDALHVVRLKDGRLMGIVRDDEINILKLIEYLRTESGTRVPMISFVESAETSLVNLVNANYEFKKDEITVIVYLGNEFSRLIFLKGNEIYTISYIIGAGLDSENITHTIYSRILLEQDNLNLPKIQNILLTGEAYEVDLRNFLKGELTGEIKIDYIKIPWLDVIGTEPLISRYAVVIGAAWRSLREKDDYSYDVNLLPVEIQEGQKRFKLGIIGWVLLILLPVVAFFSTVKIAEQRQVVRQLEIQQRFHQEELAHLQGIEMQVNAKKNQLMNYDKAFGIAEAISKDLKTWSTFLYKLGRTTRRIKNIWITELIQTSDKQATLKGYSVYRNRIPRLSEAIGGGALKKVMVQEIRDQTVYYFEMNANLPSEE